VLSPNTEPPGTQAAARATAHGAFDDDPAVLKATLARIRGVPGVVATFEHHPSESANRMQRALLADSPEVARA
jgi:hypothetical protein